MGSISLIEVYNFAADNRPSPDCCNDMLPTNQQVKAHRYLPKFHYLVLGQF